MNSEQPTGGPNMISSDVEVVSVLKGEHVLGLSRMGSQYWPYRGEYFLVERPLK